MPTRAHGARHAVAAGLLLLPTGCYRYAAFEPAAVPAPGAEVRLHLTPEGSARVAPALGAQTAVVAGRVERAGGPGAGGPGAGAGAPADAGVSLLVASTTKAYGGTMRWVGERVTIPLGAVARGERRVVDRRRSLLAGGGVALAAAAAYAALRGAGGGGGSSGDGPPAPTP